MYVYQLPQPLLEDDGLTLEEKLISSICNDLFGLKFSYKDGKIEFENLTDFKSKDFIRNLMSPRKEEILFKNKDFIKKNIGFLKNNLAVGIDCLNSEIIPVIEVCETQKQRDLFKMLRLTWSSPYSEYVGRRIKLIIRDAGCAGYPVIGIAALGSSIIRIPERDNFIGWDRQTKNKNLIYCMDAYICGAIPPYSYLLGGKLISYILASNEVREIFKKKYESQTTIINKRQSSDLAAIFTTSLYGISSQYNRIKYKDKLLYQRIGQTKGYGTFQFSQTTNRLLKEYLFKKGKSVGYKFGEGPNYKFRFIKKALDLLANHGFDSNILLNHSIKRDIYFIPLAENTLQFLNGKDEKLLYFNFPMNNLVEYWRKRWLFSRKKNQEAINKAKTFTSDDFTI